MNDRSASPSRQPRFSIGLSRLMGWCDGQLQRISVRSRLLSLCLGLVAVLLLVTLMLGWVAQQRETQEAEQKQQYDRLQSITAVREALASVRHIQGQVNVAQVIGDVALKTRLTHSLQQAEARLEAVLLTVERFDPESIEVVRRERTLSLRAMQRSIQLMASGGKHSPELATETIGHLDQIESTLKAAGDRERDKADQISRDQIRYAHSAMQLSAVILVAVLLFSVSLSLLILRSIVQPLQTTVAVLRQINAGETMVDMPPITDNEFGDMAVALRQFRDQAERLRHLAFTDELTGLGNRAHFDEALRAAVSESAHSGGHVALLYVDLDNFSAVNDSLGHGAGDRYLREAAQRLQRFALLDAELWRYSGDKFTVLLNPQTTTSEEALRNEARTQAQLMLRGLAEPVLLDAHLLPMSVSIGVAVYPADGNSAEQLMSSADAAMYLVKDSGRNGLRFANPTLTADARNDLALAADIRRGMEQREFVPYYQPIVDVVAGRVAGAEALLRWHHPQRGVCSAFQFIGVAEANGMVQALGETCLTQVCEQMVRWQAGAAPVWISVNLSTRQIEDRSVLGVLAALQQQFPFRPEGLTLEITETGMLEQMERAQQTLEEVRSLGYRLGVDDFGTGYSSMVYLQRFPVDKIKIDRSFVAQVDTSRSAKAIVAATVALARSLDLDVVAEGVETEAQMRCLTALGCHLQQGFFYTPALPPAAFERWCDLWQPPAMTAASA